MSNIFQSWPLLIDNPVTWKFSRLVLEKAFGLYSKRIQLMKNKGLHNNLSVLDIGCGIGQYSEITQGEYLGLDINNRYINYARKKYKHHNHSFRCADVTVIVKELTKYDLVLMTDFLHHIPSQQCINLLNVCSQLVNKIVINFEPVIEQSNPVGRWVNRHDRGKYVRSLDEWHQLYDESQLELVESNPLIIGPLNSRAFFAKPKKRDGATIM